MEPAVRVMLSFITACYLAVIASPAAQGAPPPLPHSTSLPKPETIPSLDPTKDLESAKPRTVYQTLAVTKGLDAKGQRTADIHYTYVLPEGFTVDEGRNLVIILHGFGVDYRWGHAQLPPGSFRSSDITVSVDGTSIADDGTRVFNPKPADAVVLRDFVLEASRAFPANRIVLVGYRQGGRFAIVFASAFPRLIDGVVAVGSGLYEETQLEGAVQALPLVLIHGIADDTTPYPLSLDAEHKLCAARHPMAMLRRLPGVEGLPDPARISPCVDWVMAMMSDDPKLALATARELLKPKQPGAVAAAPPAFHMARVLLRRFETTKDVLKNREPGIGVLYPFDEIPDDVKAQAWDLSVKLEGHAQEHVRTLKAAGILTRADLEKPTPPPMLGHLLALREDFRGIDSVESYMKSLAFDQLWDAHYEAGESIWSTRNADNLTPVNVLQQFVDDLPKAWLYDGLPVDLYSMILQLKSRTGPGAPPPELVARCAIVDEYFHAMEEGERAYKGLWKGFAP